jgi:hypothetical protein
LNVAVPLLVNCAVKRRWISVQDLAKESQKFTWPGVTGADPAMTVAVSVTTLPDETVVTALPPLLTASTVVVVGMARTGQLAASSHPRVNVTENLVVVRNWP